MDIRIVGSKIRLYNDSEWHLHYVRDFINNNLRLCLLYTECTGRFLTLDRIEKLDASRHPIRSDFHAPRHDIEDIKQRYKYTNDPFVVDYFCNEQEFCRDIVNNGMLLPLCVYQSNDGQYVVREGQHRFQALKTGFCVGDVPPDHKIFCLEIPHHLWSKDYSDLSPVLIEQVVSCTEFIVDTDGLPVGTRTVITDDATELLRIYTRNARAIGKKYYGKAKIKLGCLNDENEFNKWLYPFEDSF